MVKGKQNKKNILKINIMKSIITLLIFFTFSFTLAAQNVGVGETTPTAMKLQVKTADSAVLLLQNSTASGADIKTGLYYRTGSSYSGGIATIGSGATFRMGMFTFGGATPSALLERLSILDGGNVGIGAINPGYLLDVNGRMRLRDKGGSVTAGIWHNKADNTEAAFIGMVNDSTYGFFGNGTAGNWKMGFDIKNARMGIGVTDPALPLSFASSLGKKISLYRGTTGDAGFGVFGNELRINSDYSGSDVTFGFDNFTNGFTENMRVKGNGNTGIGVNNPLYKLDLNGRMRIRHSGLTSGIFFNNSTNTEASFIGQYTDNLFGIFGNAWKFAINRNDGTVYLGSNNLDNENLNIGSGYKLRVFGKIIGEEVRVQLKNAWPDYVFEKDYKRLSLSDLEKFVNENKHLPNMPSAKEIERDGQHLGEMQRKMLEKIEELSLYVIELKKEIDLLKQIK